MDDLPIHTSGIFVESAKFARWGILVGEKIYTPIMAKTAVKHMAKPDARPGVWIDIRCTIVNKVNTCNKCTIYGFVNLVDQKFIIPDFDQKIYGEGPEEAVIDRLPIRPVRMQDILSTDKIQEIASIVIKQMCHKWLAKFKRKFL